MNRPYLILLFTAALFLVLVGWLIYSKINAHPGTAVEPTTQPLVERLRAERERRMRERGELPPLPATTSRPQTQPSTAPAL